MPSTQSVSSTRTPCRSMVRAVSLAAELGEIQGVLAILASLSATQKFLAPDCAPVRSLLT